MKLRTWCSQHESRVVDITTLRHNGDSTGCPHCDAELNRRKRMQQLYNKERARVRYDRGELS